MNFIYFNPDEMRGDFMGCAGHPLVKTPNLDRFAAGGVRFNNCHVQHTVCTPSRCSFMTGWYPHTRGHRTLWHCLQPDEPNTLRYLKEAGYAVHWIGKNDLLSEAVFADSVSHVHTPDGGQWSGRLYDDPAHPGFMSFLNAPTGDHLHDYYIAKEAAAFLRSRQPGDPPFMLYLTPGMPHCPYQVPQPWYDMFDPDELPPLRPADLPNKPIFHKLIREYRRLGELDEGVLRKIMAVYLGMIAYVDHLFGIVLEALEETGLDAETAVFFFSDHGDWAGDYGLVEKWPSGLDDCLTRVPMLVRVPGCAAGHVIETPTACFDIMPTTLKLAGIKPRHTHDAVCMLPALAGGDGDPERAVFAEGGYDTHEPHCFEGKAGASGDIGGDSTGIYYPKGLQQQEHPESVCRAAMIRTQTHKLIWRTADIHELYDLEADPQELHNVIDDPAYAALRGELTERLLTWYVHTADVVPFTPDPRGVPASATRH